MLRRCFELHTGPLLQILRPTVVLASGNKTHSFSGNIAAKSPRTRVIRMMHYAHREGRAVERKHLKRVRSELDTLRLAHGTLANTRTEPTRQPSRAIMSDPRGSFVGYSLVRENRQLEKLN